MSQRPRTAHGHAVVATVRQLLEPEGFELTYCPGHPHSRLLAQRGQFRCAYALSNGSKDEVSWRNFARQWAQRVIRDSRS
jgi:hypothetical protein